MSNRIWLAHLEAIRRALNVHEAQRGVIPDILSAELCPRDFLPDLAWTVGLSPDVTLRGSFDLPMADAVEANWRRLINTLPEIWAAKGEHDTIRSMIRGAVRARAWLGDWFSFRLVVGASSFPFFATQAVVADGHYWTELHVEDFDGLLDQVASVFAANLVRNIGERINITFVDMIENWTDGLGRYTLSGATSFGNRTLTLGPSGAVSFALLTAGTFATWDHEIYNAIVVLAAGSTFHFRVRDDGAAAHYELRMTQGLGPNNVLLHRSGVPVATATFALGASPVEHLIHLETSPVAGGVEIGIWINGTNVIAHTDAVPLALGAVRLQTPIGSVAQLQWWEATPANPTTQSIP